jgi:hypothetical protein
MCGRYLLHADPKLIERAFGAEFLQIPRELVPLSFRDCWSTRGIECFWSESYRFLMSSWS